MLEVHKNVLKKFQVIDNYLSNVGNDYNLYHTIFSIRTKYCVHLELSKHKKEDSLFFYLKRIIKTCILVLLYPFLRIEVLNPSKITILNGYFRFDNILSKELDYPILNVKKKLSFRGFLKRVESLGYGLFYLWKILFLKLGIKGFIYCASDIINFWYYKTISLSGIKIFITENDVDPIPYAILLKAKENSLVRIKIEYVQIDSVMHNNVFADYYFYPTTYHLNIREKSKYNQHLKYIEGGYLTKREIKSLHLSETKKKFLTITYFTGHGGELFGKSDSFYIDEILSVMPRESKLNIKIHPLDKKKYSLFQADDRVSIFIFGEIDNSWLISKSHICFSIFSVMSFEAKEICNDSFFINYDINSSAYKDDYEYISNFFDIVRDKEALSDVISGTYASVSIEKFKENVNITYPTTFEIFRAFTNSLLQ